MRRGGPIFLVLAVIFVVLVVALGVFLLSPNLLAGLMGTPQTAATPSVPLEKVVVAGQNIKKDQVITGDLLLTKELPKDLVTTTMVLDKDKEFLIGQFAVADMKQGFFFSADSVTERPETGGASVISPGQVAISIPVKRTDMVGYAVKDGDYVDVIATTLFVDLDASYQSELPNEFGHIVNIGSPPESAPLVVLGVNNGPAAPRPAGRAELDPTLNQVIYFIPSEPQRARLVSQMILQYIQVLHVGTFSLDAPQTEAQPTPDPAQGGGAQSGPTAVPAAVVEPDIITLIVSPQDAVSLTYLINSGTKLTLALRAPDDQSRAETDAATLQYILSQYAIPIPAKLPYGMEPRIFTLPNFDVKATPTPRP